MGCRRKLRKRVTKMVRSVLYSNRLERIREDVPVWPVHSTSSPQARESDPTRKDERRFHNKLMKEGGRIELHRAHTRLTAYKAVSTPNGMRLPNQNLKARARVERAILTLQGRAPYRLATGPFGLPHAYGRT